METILITGARAPIAMELARSFHSQGHTVIMADSLILPVSRWSNTVSNYFKLPSPRFAPQEFADTLQQIITTHQVTHLIPTCEEAFYISSFKDGFPCKVWTSGIELLNQLHNKFLFTQVAKEYFPIPETELVNKFTTWTESENYVFKPVYSRFAGQIISNKTLVNTYFTNSEQKNWIAQKRIQGKEICIYSIWDEGKLKAYVAYHPLYRVGKGAGIFFEPVNHPDAHEKVKLFGEAISYTGQLCFDVIIDQNDIPWFIECNPRGTSGAHLVHTDLANAFLYSGTEIQQNTAEYAVKGAMAFLYPQKLLTKRVRQAKDVIFRKKDFLPFLLQFVSILEVTYIMLIKRMTWLQATTRDIEWNGNEH
ncbi:ATP-grasp domain-containing protein [Cytophagaceae bacterium YF14B1]|uniref:ATP-grasp domain-containing protein n=1 Tax=Xanthocytophaga flava TaxID=3048013 RepID=A0AAE3UBE9_9BACT|nr:ATP-grasp domain-containing protein [Xanthocytophaga flavus]MDJ1483709.1 ATP-grasp domain-containing protein [Xanthocytophaga flavus]